MNTAVYHAGALGDFITILPVLESLKRSDPDGRTVLIGKPSFAVLAGDWVDTVFDVESAALAPLYAGRTPPLLAEQLRGCGRAVAFTSPGAALVRSLRRLVRGEVQIQPPFPVGRTHVVDYHFGLIEPWSGENTSNEILASGPHGVCPRVHPSCIDVARMPWDPHDGVRRVLIHAGSGSKRKNWPFERFVETAGILRKRGWDPWWIAGPAETDRGLTGPGDALVNPPLGDLASALSQAALYIGNDSGVSHLSAACGCPSVVLFGPSDPAVWAPRGERVAIVGPPVAPGCGPCHPGLTVRCESGTCMGLITTGRVVDACDSLVSP